MFGEHSDYLGLDVIPAALDMSIQITASPRADMMIEIDYLDLKSMDSFSIEENIKYTGQRDYLRSVFNVLSRRRMQPECGWNLEVTGTIPIAAGLSSSSALTIAGVAAVAHMSKKRIDTTTLAELAFEAEVAEFGESGGKMDHYTSAFGGLIHLEFGENLQVTKLPAAPEGFVIGDSVEKKTNTVGDLRYIRETVEGMYAEFGKAMQDFDQKTTDLDRILKHFPNADTLPKRMAKTTLMNRDLTRRALTLLQEKNPDPVTLGELIDKHHEYLRDGLNRSTSMIERLISAAKDAGALGCKINGSGGGGTMMAYAPNNEEEVAAAIRKAGGKPYIVKVGSGATLTTM